MSAIAAAGRVVVRVRRAIPVLSLLLVALAPAARAQSSPMQLSLSPVSPTWQDAVAVTAAGDRWTSCGSWAFQLVDHRSGGGGGTSIIQLELVESCPILAPPTLHHIEVSDTLGRLEPGSYLLRLQDGGSTVELPFTVVMAGTGSVQLPAVITDDQPATIRAFCVEHAWGTAQAEVTVTGQELRVQCTVAPFPIEPGPGGPFPYTVSVALPVLAAGDYDLLLVDDTGLVRVPLRVWSHAGCLPAADALCLRRGRFRVRASWKAFDGSTGAARAHPLAGSDDSGLLSFFDDSNAELTVKALDGCALDHAWWLFLASGSDVQYDVTVEDTASGARRVYHNALGALPPLVADTAAFACP